MVAAQDVKISITDFSPGIWSDLYALNNANVPGATLTSSMPANGAATSSGTFGCHSDRTGALVPLPEPINPLAMPTPIPQDDNSGNYNPPQHPGAYLLDAQINPALMAGDASYIGDAIWDTTQDSLFTLYGGYWSYDGNGIASGDFPFVVGREWRRYNTNLGTYNVYDFLYARMTNRTPRGTAPDGILPAGQLVATRYYHGRSAAGQSYITTNSLTQQFVTAWSVPVIVAIATAPYPFHKGTNYWRQGIISALEQAMLTQQTSAGSSALTAPFSYFSPTYIPTNVGNNLASAVVMSNLNSQSNFSGGPISPSRLDGWSAHMNEQWNTTANWPNNVLNDPYLATAHQGRLVMVDRTTAPNTLATEYDQSGTAGGVYSYTDIVRYSDYGLPLQDTVTITQAAYGSYPANLGSKQYNATFFAEDVVAHTGTIGTVTNDQLLIVKHRGGAVLVTGDLDNPVVRRLPSVESTNGIVSKGVQTPIGFVYGSRNGIYAWQGGDKSVKLSKNLEGFFWDHTQGSSVERYSGSRGRLGYWNNMVWVPNNYVYDTVGGGWWRHKYTNAAVFPCNAYLERTDGNLWALAYKVGPQTGNSTTVAVQFDRNKLGTYYTWQSQPLVETQDRLLSFHDIRILVTSNHLGTETATIKTTLTGYDSAGNVTTVVNTFTPLQMNKPQNLRQDIQPNFVAEYVTLRIEAQVLVTAGGAPGASAAPKIHAVTIGTTDRSMVPRHG